LFTHRNIRPKLMRAIANPNIHGPSECVPQTIRFQEPDVTELHAGGFWNPPES
jgi:hypothetical protein